MCGIFGIAQKENNTANLVLEGLKTLEYRGYDSWGVAVISKLKIFVKKDIGKIGNATVNDMPLSNIGFGHTRWATHGGVTVKNSHPHLCCNQKIAVIHNGIVENYQELKDKYLKNHKFVSQTDTEIIAHLIEEFQKESLTFEKAVIKTFDLLKGSNAIIVMHQDFQGLIAIRNGSPLIVGFGKDKNILASDTSAILPHTKKIYYLNDNELAIVKNDSIVIQNIKTNKLVIPKIEIIKWTISQNRLGKFPNFMFKEINEQPQIIKNIALNSISDIKKLAKVLRQSYGSYLIGCGSAYYAALSGSYIFSKIAKKHINTAIGSEFGYHLEFLTNKSLVIPLSQSGETMDILESVKKAKEKNAKILSIVNVPYSTLSRLSDYNLIVGAGPEKAVASTKAFLGKIANLILLAYAQIEKIDQGQKLLLHTASVMSQILNSKHLKKIKSLAQKIKNYEHIYIVGRGLSYPVAMETAMKIKEISYIHAEGFAAGELKHGTLALVEKNTPCIVFLPNDETYGDTLAAAMEMRARGGQIIGISNSNHEIFNEFLKVDDCNEATILPNVLTGQLLAYYLTAAKGFDIDKPRNLAKSVTVK